MNEEILVKTILEYGDYICEQTNSIGISFGDLSDYDDKDIHEIEIDGYKFKVGVTKVVVG